MKKLFALLMVAGSLSFTACNNKTKTESEQVIESDTTDTTYKVEETVVTTDTTITSDTTTNTDKVESGETENK